NPLNAPSIVSGSMDLKVEDADSYALAGDWTRMLPGDRITEEVDVALEGTVQATVTASSSNTSNFLVRVVKGSCPETMPPVIPVPLGVWEAKESSPVCVEVTLASSAVQDTTEDFTITFVATQNPS